jgi:DNA-binding transcriptional LysR family regulator
MSSSEVDLRHLRIFISLFTTKNVTRAAESVGLSQSAVSVVLGQLRDHYDDPLFVRTAEGMQPTPRAILLEPVIKQAMELLNQGLARPEQFDPANITRMFRICMPDVGQISLLPRLLSEIHQIAPNISIKVGNISLDTPRLLENGDADMAIGFTGHINNGFYQQKLFEEAFVCIAAHNHPRIGGRMTLAQLRQERHIEIQLSATAHAVVSKFLARKGVERVFALEVTSFLGVGQLVANSDLVAIIPLRLGAIFASESKVKLVSLPFSFPTYAVNQFWHDRYHRDPGNVWFRSMVYEAAKRTLMPTMTE